MTLRISETSVRKSLTSKRTHWQSWLDVEAALARAQARIGMIPQWAADSISQNAKLEIIGEEALQTSIKNTLAPIMSLTRLLAERSGQAGDYVHWGATTQNVMQTGRLLVLKRVDSFIFLHLATTLDHLSELAERHAETPMVARTNRRHALPISFGFKVAGWIEEINRATERLNETRARVFRLPFGGAVGAMHAYGHEGQALCSALAEELDLGELLVPSRTVNDLFVEFIVGHSLLAMTIERIMQELYLLMEEEIGEVSEILSDQVIGSSTMPHKVNPKLVVKIISLCARLRSLSSPAMEAGIPSHEGDSAANGLLSAVLDDACKLGCEISQRTAELLALVKVHPDRMLHNLTLTGTALASENLMMKLATKIGRSNAHDVIHQIISNHQNHDLNWVLTHAPEITVHFTPQQIEQMLNFRDYKGQSARMARQAAVMAKQTSLDLKHQFK